jgi:hypothetical protein
VTTLTTIQELTQAIILDKLLVMQSVVLIVSFSWSWSLSMVTCPVFTPIWAKGWPKGVHRHFIDWQQPQKGVSCLFCDRSWDVKWQCSAWLKQPLGFLFPIVKMYTTMVVSSIYVQTVGQPCSTLNFLHIGLISYKCNTILIWKSWLLWNLFHYYYTYLTNGLSMAILLKMKRMNGTPEACPRL